MGLAFGLIIVLNACQGNDTNDVNKDATVLRYANWNLGTEEENNLERQMIQAYEAANPDVKIEIDESITGDWMEALATAASAGNLPDVFMLSDTVTSYANQWLLDLSDLAMADEEFNHLPLAVQNATKLNGSVYAIPFAQFMMGYYINKDLFNQLNLSAPVYGLNVEELVTAIRDTTDLNQPFVGVNSIDQFIDWYPGVVNSNLGWFTFTDGRYHLDSEEMLQGMRLASELGRNDYTYVGLTDEQQKLFTGENDADAFRAGQMAMFYNGSWMNNDFAQNADFQWDFIGIPGERSALTLDQVGIAKTAEHPEIAYDFAKWMSYGKEGYLERLEIVVNQGVEINALPVTSDVDLLNRYWEIVDVPGIREAYENLDNAMIDGNKIVPGYIASRWEGNTGVQVEDIDNANIGDIFWHSVYGTINYQDYGSQVNVLAQQYYDEAVSAMAP